MIRQEDLNGVVDLLVEVDRAGIRQCRAVGVEGVGNARRVGDDLFNDVRRREPEPNGGESFDVRSDGIRVGLSPDLDMAL